MAGELFRHLADIDVWHVPYKTTPDALTDLIGGQITYTIDGIAIQLPQVRAGRIRALAVTSSHRLAALPDIPTIAESGLPGYEYWSWMGVCAPAGTPKEIIARLNAEITKIARTPEARAWFEEQGGEPVTETPEQFAAYIRYRDRAVGKSHPGSRDQGRGSVRGIVMTTTTEQAALRQMIDGYRISKIICVAAELGLADHLASGPKHYAELATASGTNAQGLYRLLRALSSVGVFEQIGEQRFALNPRGALFAKTHRVLCVPGQPSAAGCIGAGQSSAIALQPARRRSTICME